VTRTVPRSGAALLYYVVATLIRTADAGAPAAIVLTALRLAGSGHPHAGADAALLAACISIPHMFGPLSARAMSMVPSAHAALAGSFAVFAVLFPTAGLLIGHAQIGAAAAVLVLAGFVGPIFTGGLSSHLGSLVSPEQSSQRRAQSADSLTYAISGTAGNLFVGAVSVMLSPLTAMLALAVFAAMAAVAVPFLPLSGRATSAARKNASIKNVLSAMLWIRDLRLISIITFGNAIGFGSLIVLATSFARHADLPASAGPALISVMAAGSFVTSSYFTVRPLSFDVMKTARWCAVVSGVFVLLSGLFNVWLMGVTFLVVGGCQSVLNTSAFAVRREASPDDLRASVFVTMAGIKIAFASIGLALAGLVPVNQVAIGLAVAGLVSLLAGIAPAGRADRFSEQAAAMSTT
jgi:hypothetical protein